MFQIKNEIIIGLVISLILGGIAARFVLSYPSPVAQDPVATNSSEVISDEVAKHDNETDCWIIVDGQVLDVTSFLSIHLGGAKAITAYCGKDATSAFNSIEDGQGHSAKAVAMFEKYLVKTIGKNVTNQIKTGSTPLPDTATTTLTPPTSNVDLSISEVAKHNAATDCWIIINNKVLKITPFLSIHPGGSDVITPYCGKDATAAFDNIGHSNKAVGMIANYVVGMFGQTVTTDALTPQVSTPPITNNNDDDKEEEYEDD